MYFFVSELCETHSVWNDMEIIKLWLHVQATTIRKFLQL